MKSQLTCQVCTAILIKTEINGNIVCECPICGQMHKQDGEMIEYKDLYAEDKIE